MNKQKRMFMDQYGQVVWATTVKELREAVGGGRTFKIYRDTPQGVKHVGYGVGHRWFSEFQPVEREA